MAKATVRSKPESKSGAAKTETKKQTGTTHLNRMPAVTPHLVVAGAAKAIDFYKKAFGAKELMRLEGPDGMMWHACVEILGAPIMLVDEFPGMGCLGPKAMKGTTVTIHLNVPDADAFVAHAVKAGATLKMAVAEAFWGDRYGQIEDPFGHRWSVATHVRDLTIDEIKAAMPTASGMECGDAASAS